MRANNQPRNYGYILDRNHCRQCGCDDATASTTTADSRSSQCSACGHVHESFAGTARSLAEQNVSLVAPAVFPSDPRAMRYMLDMEAEFRQFTKKVIARRKAAAETSVENRGGVDSGNNGGDRGQEQGNAVETVPIELELEPRNSFNRMICYLLADRFGLSHRTAAVQNQTVKIYTHWPRSWEYKTVPVKRITFWFTSDEDAVLPVLSVKDHWVANRIRIDLRTHAFASFAGSDMRVDAAAAVARRALVPAGEEAFPAAGVAKHHAAPSVDVLHSIFSFMPARTVVLTCAKVCRTWREASRADAVWTRVARLFFDAEVVDGVSASEYSSMRQWFLDAVAKNRLSRGARLVSSNSQKVRRELRIWLLQEALEEIGCAAWRLAYIENCNYVRNEDDDNSLLQARSRLLRILPPDSTPTIDPFDADRSLNDKADGQ